MELYCWNPSLEHPKIFCWEKCKNTGFWESRNFELDKTVSHCVIRRLLIRHYLIGRAAASKLVKTFGLTDECRFKLRSDGWIWVSRSQNERYNIHGPLSSSNDLRSLHFCGGIAYDGTVRLIKAREKCNSLDYIPILEEVGAQFFTELEYKLC